MQILARGEHLGIYHVGNPEEISVQNVVEQVFKVLGREPRIVCGPLTQGSTERRCPDISKLRSIGYEPTISFAQGLPSLVHWYMQHATNR